MLIHRPFKLLVALALSVAPTLTGQMAVAQAAPHVSPAAVITWNTIA